MSEDRSGATGGGAGDPVRIERLLVTRSILLIRVAIAPGAEMEPHRHRDEYVVIPLTEGRVMRVVRRNAKVIDEVAIEMRAEVPYHVEPTEPRTTIAIRNVGAEEVRFMKAVIKPPKPTKPATAKSARSERGSPATKPKGGVKRPASPAGSAGRTTTTRGGKARGP